MQRAAVFCSAVQCVAALTVFIYSSHKTLDWRQVLHCSCVYIVCCRVPQYAAECCGVLQCFAACCRVLHSILNDCDPWTLLVSVLQCIAVCRGALQSVAVLGLVDSLIIEHSCQNNGDFWILLVIALQWFAVCCSVPQCVAVLNFVHAFVILAIEPKR